jgi:protein-tyrosine phosphatase
MTLIDNTSSHTLLESPESGASESAGKGSAEIPLSLPVNLRDLGGIPAANGFVRSGFAIRADDLSTVTSAYAEQLVDGGLRAVIDLRSSAEIGITGRGPLGEQATVSYHHLPFLADVSSAADEGHPLDQSSYGRMYVRMFEAAAPHIVSALGVIAHAPGTTAFHCAAGQDRTGVLAASLLLVLGTDRESVIEDYARTGQNSAAIHARIAPMLLPLMDRMGFTLDDAARAATRKAFSEEPMRELLSTISERHGHPVDFLREAGLTDGLVATLRERAIVEHA